MRKNNSNILLGIIILLSLFSYYDCILILPLKTIHLNDTEDTIEYIFNSKFGTVLTIGSEKAEIFCELRFDRNTIDILEDEWSFVNSRSSIIDRDYSDIYWEETPAIKERGYVINDTFLFNSYVDKKVKEEKKTKEGKLVLANKNITNDIISSIGFGLFAGAYTKIYYTISLLKNVKLINDYTISLKFKKPYNNQKYQPYDKILSYKDWIDTEGELIVGGKLYNIDNNGTFKEEFYQTTQTKPMSFKPYSLFLEFDDIFVGDHRLPISYFSTNGGFLSPNFQFILGTGDYQKDINSSFFEQYFENKICIFKKTNDKLYGYIVCNKENFLYQNLPDLIMYNRILGFNFTLNYLDLFFENGNKIYFAIIFSFYPTDKGDVSSGIRWDFGLPFLRKYLFSFNSDSKLIGVYTQFGEASDEDDEGNAKKRKIKIIIILVSVSLLLILIFVFVGMCIQKYINKKKQRKKRADELDDEFIYESKKKDESQNDPLSINN